MPVKVKGAPIETKPFAGLGTNGVIGYIVALVFVLWPSFANRIPEDMQLQLPVVIGTVLGAVVAYFAPHTSRPDLGSGLVLPFTDKEIEQIKYMAAQQEGAQGQ